MCCWWLVATYLRTIFGRGLLLFVPLCVVVILSVGLYCFSIGDVNSVVHSEFWWFTFTLVVFVFCELGLRCCLLCVIACFVLRFIVALRCSFGFLVGVLLTIQFGLSVAWMLLYGFAGAVGWKHFVLL